MDKKRTYPETHPWLDFELNLNRFDSGMWLSLGEAVSKADHIAGVPLKPGFATEMHQVYLAKGALATTAIEGNTLSEQEALDRVKGGHELPPSKEYLGREIDNIVTACNKLGKAVLSDQGSGRITVDLLAWMNRTVLNGLEVAAEVEPGQLRRHRVEVGRYRGAPPEDCPFLLEALCQELEKFPSLKGFEKVSALIKAVYAHLNFVWIHPFGDGNGRTARLLEFFILLAGGFPTPTCHLLSNHYNATRTRYYQRLDAASQSPEGRIDFYRYALEGFLDGVREQVERIRQHQWAVSWTDYVHSIFKGKDSPTQIRRRRLLLSLSGQSDFAPVSDIPNLSPETARGYAAKTGKTITRDLNALEKLGLVERRRGAVRAKTEIILAFLPRRNITG